MAVAGNHQALVEMGVENSVTTFTMSEFARTLNSNGDGSDHAWGGVQRVLGDSVRGRSARRPGAALRCPGVDAGAGHKRPA